MASQRIVNIPFSPIRQMGLYAAQIEKQGGKVIHLEIGRPDFDTPKHIKQAAKDALDMGKVHYTSNYGILGLRRAIASKLETEQSLQYDPENEIVATAGATEAIFTVLQAIFNPGDGLIVPTPAFIPYLSLPRILGLDIQEIPLREINSFLLDPSELERNIRSNSKALVLVSPHNPTGSLIPEAKLKRIAEICVRHNLAVLADEVYEKILYGGRRFKSIAAFPKMKERTFLVNSFSKTYSMTGWRLGYLCGPKQLIDQTIKVHLSTVACTCSFVQYGGLAALNGPQTCVEEMVAEFQRRRNFLVKSLGEIGMPCDTPTGAFYVFPKVSQYGMNSTDFATFLLQKAKVATVPGVAFGASGEGYIRISYANSMENLERAVSAIEKATASPC